MYNPEPRIITFGDTSVTVKMMDDSWIINQCVSHSPFVPKPGVVWSHEDRCSRVQIPGDQFEDAMRSFRDAYGNAAVIAWDGNVALGHIIFVPKAEARKQKMLFHERMPASAGDDKTLVVEAVAFCSIGGQKYRRRGNRQGDGRNDDQLGKPDWLGQDTDFRRYIGIIPWRLDGLMYATEVLLAKIRISGHWTDQSP